MSATVVSFKAIPRAIDSEGEVRFYAMVSGSVRPIKTCVWDFGDSTATAEGWTLVHTYPVASSYSHYDVSLKVYDSDGIETCATVTDFIASYDKTTVATPVDWYEYYSPISVLMFNDEASMLATRIATRMCSYYLMNPKINTSIDKIGTMTFTLVDIGNSTAAEQAIVAEGSYVVAIMGLSVVFSGIIRRASNDTQGAFADSTIKLKKWEIECDSDLGKLRKLKVNGTSLPVSGQIIIDNPINIARRIML